jgi:glycyl-tRNA synthetase
VLGLHPKLAPVTAAVFPLVANKTDIVDFARRIYRELKRHIPVAWDDRGNIGKRYLSQDEIGTPWCITVDYDTLERDTVTVRDRDTTRQERVGVGRLVDFIRKKLNNE